MVRRAVLALLFGFALPLSAQQRTILAIGAHAGDMELTTGAVLLAAHQRGDRVVLLHMTLGEGGNAKLTPAEYGAQKRREALAVAKSLGAEVIFAPYRDGELPNDDATRRYVADVIRQVKPTLVFTHWRESMHKDHSTTSAVVQDAVLLASLAGVVTDHPAHRGVRAVWYADNWEDATNFSPYVFVKVAGVVPQWKAAVSQYEFALGATSGFAYVDYYTALATVRGAIARKGEAVAFAVQPESQRRVLDSLP
jgi:LmbE family N-acetylglucosaminyl deacetylase